MFSGPLLEWSFGKSFEGFADIFPYCMMHDCGGSLLPLKPSTVSEFTSLQGKFKLQRPPNILHLSYEMGETVTGYGRREIQLGINVFLAKFLFVYFTSYNNYILLIFT